MSFETNIETIRKQAREHMMEGAVTASYGANREEVCKVLNDMLATEIVCALRYRNNHYVALGLGAHRAADELLEHAAEEESHRSMIAERITQLGGMPNFDPSTLAKRSHAEYSSKASLGEILRENLVAERVAVAMYSEIVRWLGDADPTSRRLVEQVLAQEEEHADDLVDLIQRVEGEWAGRVD
ncbi:MAG: bacterioferritin [Sandaracinaceae bacterium]